MANGIVRFSFLQLPIIIAGAGEKMLAKLLLTVLAMGMNNESEISITDITVIDILLFQLQLTADVSLLGTIVIRIIAVIIMT